jgi:acetate kinase
VFTAGVGEIAAPVRAAICRACAWLGVKLDEAANAAHGLRISAPGSRMDAWVVPTDGNRTIARYTLAVMRG